MNIIDLLLNGQKSLKKSTPFANTLFATKGEGLSFADLLQKYTQGQISPTVSLPNATKTTSLKDPLAHSALYDRTNGELHSFAAIRTTSMQPFESAAFMEQSVQRLISIEEGRQKLSQIPYDQEVGVIRPLEDAAQGEQLPKEKSAIKVAIAKGKQTAATKVQEPVIEQKGVQIKAAAIFEDAKKSENKSALAKLGQVEATPTAFETSSKEKKPSIHAQSNTQKHFSGPEHLQLDEGSHAVQQSFPQMAPRARKQELARASRASQKELERVEELALAKSPLAVEGVKKRFASKQMHQGATPHVKLHEPQALPSSKRKHSPAIEKVATNEQLDRMIEPMARKIEGGKQKDDPIGNGLVEPMEGKSAPNVRRERTSAKDQIKGVEAHGTFVAVTKSEEQRVPKESIHPKDEKSLSPSMKQPIKQEHLHYAKEFAPQSSQEALEPARVHHSQHHTSTPKEAQGAWIAEGTALPQEGMREQLQRQSPFAGVHGASIDPKVKKGRQLVDERRIGHKEVHSITSPQVELRQVKIEMIDSESQQHHDTDQEKQPPIHLQEQQKRLVQQQNIDEAVTIEAQWERSEERTKESSAPLGYRDREPQLEQQAQRMQRARHFHFQWQQMRVQVSLGVQRVQMQFVSEQMQVPQGMDRFIDEVMQEHGFNEYRVRLKDRERELEFRSHMKRASAATSMIDVKA